MSHDRLVDEWSLPLDVNLVRLHRYILSLLDHLKLDWLLVEILLIFELALRHCLTVNLLALINCHCRKMLVLGVIKGLSHLGLGDKWVLMD